MLDKAFENYISSLRSAVPAGAKVEPGWLNILVSVSGGLDSVVLGWLFHTVSDLNWSVAHVNFGLRGKESDEDEHFVRRLTKQWQRPCHVLRHDTTSLAKKRRVSLQMVARQLRYEGYQKLCRQHNFTHIALAHHANDGLETLLLNLARGTGWLGVLGIRPVSKNIIRPLLYETRKSIRNYALSQHIVWREDSSNQSLDYRRNQVRHKVVPELNKLNKNLAHTFLHTQRQLHWTRFLLEDARHAFEKKYLVKHAHYHLLRLPSAQPMTEQAHAYVWEVLRRYGLRIRQYLGILHTLSSSRVGKVIKTPTHVLNIDRGQVLLMPNDLVLPKDIAWDLDSDKQVLWGWYQLCAERVKEDSFQVAHQASPDPYLVFLDEQKVSSRLVVRSARPGDSMRPLGLGGRKKLSDLMVDAKIPLLLKPHQPVLCSGREIVWLAGHHMSETCAVRPETRHVLKIRCVQMEGAP